MSFSPFAATATASPPTSLSSFFLQNLSNLGLGYAIAIAIALGVLVLLSTVLLARARSKNPNRNGGGVSTGENSNDVVLPRIIFIPEEEKNDEDNNGEEGGRGGRGSAPTGLDPAEINFYLRFPFSAAKGWDAEISIKKSWRGG